MKRVALTMRVEEDSVYHEVRDIISHDFIEFLSAQDIDVCLLSNAVQDIEGFIERMAPDAVIFSGGNDIGSLSDDFSGASVSERRDKCERTVLAHAIATRLPVLGVCRGMQLINVFFQGGIVRDLMSEPGGLNHAGEGHFIDLKHPCFVGWAGAKEVETNSFHNQGIVQRALSSELEVAAIAGDVIEAVMHRELPIIGVQWHPERQGSCAGLDFEMLRALMSGRWQG